MPAIFFDTFNTASHHYPGYEKVPAQEPKYRFHQGRNYVKVGKTLSNLSSVKRKHRIIVTIAAVAVSLFSIGIPLFYRSYRRIIYRNWREWRTNQRKLGIYVTEQSFLAQIQRKTFLRAIFTDLSQSRYVTQQRVIELKNICFRSQLVESLEIFQQIHHLGRQLTPTTQLMAMIIECNKIMLQKLGRANFVQYADPHIISRVIESLYQDPQQIDNMTQIVDSIHIAGKMTVVMSELNATFILSISSVLKEHQYGNCLKGIIGLSEPPTPIEEENPKLRNFFLGITRKGIASYLDIITSVLLNQILIVQNEQPLKVASAIGGITQAFNYLVENEIDPEVKREKLLLTSQLTSQLFQSLNSTSKGGVLQHLQVQKNDSLNMLRGGGLFTTPPLFKLLMIIWYCTWNAPEWHDLIWKVDLDTLPYLFLSMRQEQKQQTMDLLNSILTTPKGRLAKRKLAAIKDALTPEEVSGWFPHDIN